MTLLPLVFLLNGLSVPELEIDPADLSDVLQQAQQISIADPERCIQLTESVQQLQDNPVLAGRSNRSNTSLRLRDRLLQRNSRQQTQALLIGASCRDIRLTAKHTEQGTNAPDPYAQLAVQSYRTARVTDVSDAEFAALQPRHVRARAIRQLTPGEHALAHGLPMEVPDPDKQWEPETAPEVRAPDGDGLADQLAEIL